MDIAAAFLSVAEKYLLRKMRNMGNGQELVEWRSSFMRGCRVQMVYEGHEERMKVTIGLPQGSAVSFILFVIYIGEVHDTVEDKCDVASVSFVDDVT